MIMVFFYSAFIYFIESFFITELGNITIMNFVTSIFVFIIIASLYLLLTTLFGVRAGRYIVMSVIVLISLGPTIISKLRIKINFDFLKNLNDSLLIIILLISTLLIYLISLKISIISYSNKEL